MVARAEKSDRGAELRAALAFYRDLAGWHLRRGEGGDAAAELERSLEVAVAIVTVRPGDALSALLADEPLVLTTRPVPGGTNSAFGVRKNPFRKRASRARAGRERHSGVDVSAARGTPVHAAGAGLVVRAERGGGYGRVVYIDHGGGLETRYAHLQKILVEEGDFVPAGGVVGKVGSSGRATGPHLHFEVRQGGRAVAPTRILSALLAPPTVGIEWLGRLAAHDEPVADKPAKKKRKARRKHARDHRRHDRELRSRRPAS